MKLGARVLALALALALTPAMSASSFAQSSESDYPKGKISGYFFLDAYYNAAGDSSGIGTKQGIDGKGNIGKDLNGFLLRRAYFQHDADLSPKFSTRFRLEADSKSLTSDGKIGVAVKNAYVEAKSVVPRGDFYMGVLSTPTFDNSEGFWAYRSIEKTLLDFFGFGKSADVGVAMKGWFDPSKKIGYSAMIGNGNGQAAETNRYKKFMLAVPTSLAKGLKFEPYVDYEPKAGMSDVATYKLFAGYEHDKGAIGGEVVNQIKHDARYDAGKGTYVNASVVGYSLFVRYMAQEKLGAYARFDGYEPDSRNADRYDTRLWMAGLDWQPYKDVHILPNLEGAQYVAHRPGVSGLPQHPDLQARVTMYWKFSKP
jgi:hypothetical protein